MKDAILRSLLYLDLSLPLKHGGGLGDYAIKKVSKDWGSLED